MAIRPLRMRLTKEDVKNMKSAIKSANYRNKSTTGRLSRYIIYALFTLPICFILSKQVLIRLTKNSSANE